MCPRHAQLAINISVLGSVSKAKEIFDEQIRGNRSYVKKILEEEQTKRGGGGGGGGGR
jgi:hypothetical protein